MARRKARAAVETAKNVAVKKAEEVKERVETVAEAVEEKAEEVKAEVKEEVETVVEEVKEEAAPVVEEVKEEEAAPVAEEKKKPGRKPGSKNKTTVKEEKKEESVTEVYLQFGPGESSLQTVVDRIRAEYVEQGHRVSSIKSLKVYLKPEERSAYYVINEKVAGRVDLF